MEGTKVRSLRLGTIVLLAVALAATGCTSGGGGTPSSPPAPGAGSGTPVAGADRLNLGDVCPSAIVVQTDWFPETEYAVLYHLLGPNPKVDAAKNIVSAPLVAEGKDTGVRLEVRSGGPATEFKLVSEQMYTDKSIMLGQVNTDEAIRFVKDQPTLAVAAPMEISPFMIMWDPQTYPQFNIIADIGQTNAKVRYFKGDTYMEYLVGSGILRRSQLDNTYDGSSTKFYAAGGKITQAGFATSEPYLYENDPKWGRKLNFALVNDTGYPFYPQALSIRAADKQKLAPCLRKLVPIVQRAQIDFINNAKDTNDLIIKLVNQYHNELWGYDEGIAGYALRQMKEQFISNGDDKTLGNFDAGRIQRLIEIVNPILAGQRANYDPDLKPQDLYTNEFIDPSIGIGVNAS
jgi:hypothetical protein